MVLEKKKRRQKSSDKSRRRDPLRFWLNGESPGNEGKKKVFGGEKKKEKASMDSCQNSGIKRKIRGKDLAP